MIVTKLLEAKLAARKLRRAALAREALRVVNGRREELLTSPSATTRDGRLTDAALDAAVARRLELKELDARLPNLQARVERFKTEPVLALVGAGFWKLFGLAEWGATKAAQALAVAWCLQHPSALRGAFQWVKTLAALAVKFTG